MGRCAEKPSLTRSACWDHHSKRDLRASWRRNDLLRQNGAQPPATWPQPLQLLGAVPPPLAQARACAPDPQPEQPLSTAANRSSSEVEGRAGASRARAGCSAHSLGFVCSEANARALGAGANRSPSVANPATPL